MINDESKYVISGPGINRLFFFLSVFLIAFLYKCWNERQMTHEYHAQAEMLRAIAGELQTANEYKSEKRMVQFRVSSDGKITAGTYGGR